MVITRERLRLKRKLGNDSKVNSNTIDKISILKRRKKDKKNQEEEENISDISDTSLSLKENKNKKRKISRVEKTNNNISESINKKLKNAKGHSTTKNSRKVNKNNKKNEKSEDSIIIISDIENDRESEAEIIDIENISDNHSDNANDIDNDSEKEFEKPSKYNLRRRNTIIYNENINKNNNKRKLEEKEESEEEEEEGEKEEEQNKKKRKKGNNNNKKKKNKKKTENDNENKNKNERKFNRNNKKDKKETLSPSKEIENSDNDDDPDDHDVSETLIIDDNEEEEEKEDEVENIENESENENEKDDIDEKKEKQTSKFKNNKKKNAITTKNSKKENKNKSNKKNNNKGKYTKNKSSKTKENNDVEEDNDNEDEEIEKDKESIKDFNMEEYSSEESISEFENDEEDDDEEWEPFEKSQKSKNKKTKSNKKKISKKDKAKHKEKGEKNKEDITENDDFKDEFNSTEKIILNDNLSDDSETDEEWETNEISKKSKNKNKSKNNKKSNNKKKSNNNSKKKKDKGKDDIEGDNDFKEELSISENLTMEDNLSEESETDEEWEQVEISSDKNDSEISSSDKLLKDKRSITISFDDIKKKKKEKKKGIAKQDRDLRKSIHQVQLLCFVSACRIWNAWCNSNLIQNIAFSILPENLLFNKKEIKSSKVKQLSELINDLCQWFIHFVGKKNIKSIYNNNIDNDNTINTKSSNKKSTSTNSKSSKNKNEKEDDNNKENVINKKMTEKKQKYEVKTAKIFMIFLNWPQWIPYCENAEILYMILFVLFARLSGFQCRFTASLYPIPLSFSKKKKITNEAIELWCEIYCAKEKLWIPVNPLYSPYISTKPFQYNITCQKPINYIVTINQDGFIKERTKRYDKKFYLSTWKLRVDEEWWNDIIKEVYNKNLKEDKLKEIIPEEEDVDKRMVFPTSIGGFVNHPLYALERHVKQYEILYSREPVLGYIRNEPIYPRSNVRPVSTEGHWVRDGLQIKKGEKPMKYAKSKAYMLKQFRLEYLIKKKAALPKDYELGDEMVPLYGKWQTEPYVPKPIVNGIIPKSKYGNIDLFKPSMLPKGAVHLNYKGIAQVAKRLGIDYADAITDIDFAGAHYVPSINGIVVLKENADIILSKYRYFEKERERKLQEKRVKRIYGNWRRLIKKLITREELREKYDSD